MGLCNHNRGSDQTHEMEEELEPMGTSAEQGTRSQQMGHGAKAEQMKQRANGVPAELGDSAGPAEREAPAEQETSMVELVELE